MRRPAGMPTPASFRPPTGEGAAIPLVYGRVRMTAPPRRIPGCRFGRCGHDSGVTTERGGGAAAAARVAALSVTQIVETPNSIRSRSTAQVLCLLSAGLLAGWSMGTKIGVPRRCAAGKRMERGI